MTVTPATSNTTTQRKRAIPPPKTRAELIAEFNSLNDSARINEVMLAAILLCSLAKVQRDRVFGGGVPFVREGGKLTTDKNGNTRIFGGRVYYLKQDVLDFLKTRNKTVVSTSAASVALRAERRAA